MRNRLGGNLCVTRALGDFNFIEHGLIVKPHVSELKLEKS